MSRKIDETTQPSLLVRLKDHSDATAWSRFVEVYTPLIYDFCRARGLPASDAGDVSQEVLLRVAKAIRSFEYDRQLGLFRDWLARIVLNELRRHIGKTKSNPISLDTGKLDLTSMQNEWNESFQQHAFQTALERTQSHFTDHTWTLFELSWLQKKPVGEVAELAGVSLQQVYVARSRVLNRLRFEVAAIVDETW
ncbi:sigma-70 family RNA polymerase sigma factor [Pirellulaceae bacterium SH449]